jgi:tetratricopeptide (TPR) repeat protein
MKHILITFCTTILILGCSSNRAQFKGVPFEKHTTLNGTGFSQQGLDSLTGYLKNNFETTGMLVLQNGKILYEYGDIEEVSYIASCRKSVLSILYGKYVENGTIDLDQTIGEIGIEENEGLLEIEKTATVDHIINSRSGVFYKPANSGYDENNILKRGSVKPGEYFVYNNWDFNVAGSILEKKSGNNIYKEIEEQLAIPLGFEDWNIKNQKKKYKKGKSKHPAYHIYISTRDMAKIGQLMLNKGKWNGKQIISEKWIEKITRTVTPTKTVNERYGKDESSPFQFSYGYMWWLIDNFKHHPDFEGAYTASGWGGQYITVIPKRKIVIAHKYKVPKLVNWGLKSGGVSEHSYWNLIFNAITGKKSIIELFSHGESFTQIINFINQENPITSEYDISESSINNFGYDLINRKEYKNAIEIFKLNIQLYPISFNVYDSYGECLLLLGQKEKGIEAYKKSLALNPNNENAKKILKENTVGNNGHN